MTRRSKWEYRRLLRRTAHGAAARTPRGIARRMKAVRGPRSSKPDSVLWLRHLKGWVVSQTGLIVLTWTMTGPIWMGCVPSGLPQVPSPFR